MRSEFDSTVLVRSIRDGIVGMCHCVSVCLVLSREGYFSSTNLNESSWSDESSARFDPTS